MSDQQAGADEGVSRTRSDSGNDLWSRYRDFLTSLPPIREDLVARIRDELDKGTYETGIRVDVAVERLLEDLS